jgi:hypothetical protein
MIFEIIIVLAAIVLIAAVIWWVLGFFNRDEPIVPTVAAPIEQQAHPAGPPKLKLSKPAGFIPPPPPDPDAPKLKLSKPAGLVPPPATLSLSDVSAGTESSPRFSLKTEEALRLLPTGFSYYGVRVLCRGTLPWRVSRGCRLVFDVADFNHAVQTPVFCYMAGYSDPKNGLARHVCPDEPPAPGVLAEWTELAFLPLSMFVGPKSGLRALSLRCGIMPLGGDPADSVWASATVFKANLELPGYREDPLDKVIVVFSRIVELAMACAAADGVSDAREKEVIQEWIENWAQRMEEEGLECVSRFRGALLAILSSPIRSSFTQELAAVALIEHAEGKRMEALALCVRVISVDGVLHDKEMKMIERLSELLVIDRTIMRSLFDKQFASSGIIVSPDNLEALVGIDPSWDKERIREHLSERFMKWNSMAPSAKTTEDQARIRAMLDAIAKLKHKYA